ncbi:uncharacterized protein LOC125711925 isoform X2 [Brienomyrus brachyistius]|uniref:uncharacterized protein LOC125711925 isoform X2 n=1 Tax=Brienomyrus brachyistius TaxID=42636 RepID=UPI0020B18362|nr:uncharacterized protein LOC125711925 isoform X2 [Brienomyrus brachyistius]XP_048837327.1 uncharacterized protein LOC125711925 isoform X2 [Brienomyrus brachyistius]XP_048837328.1 uncharacterized protein LOC125711925 isoform X2 [Brienomyrus brachyistius]
MQHLAWIVLIFWVCHMHGCMHTDLRKEALEGSNVHLPCNFSSCPQTLDHRLSVEWEFNNTEVLIYFYANITVIAWPTLTFTGDVGVGDFSIVMHSVTCNQSGTYLCRSRSPDSPLIFKSYTQMTVTYNPAGTVLWHLGSGILLLRNMPLLTDVVLICFAGNTSHTDENQEKTINPDRGPRLRKTSELSWMVGPVLLIAAAVLGVLVRWRKRLFRWTAQCLDQGKSAPSGDMCPPHQNQGLYSTCRQRREHLHAYASCPWRPGHHSPLQQEDVSLSLRTLLRLFKNPLVYNQNNT